jgi:hypothetical protein
MEVSKQRRGEERRGEEDEQLLAMLRHTVTTVMMATASVSQQQEAGAGDRRWTMRACDLKQAGGGGDAESELTDARSSAVADDGYAVECEAMDGYPMTRCAATVSAAGRR